MVIDGKCDVQRLKKILKRKLPENYETGLYILKFHLLDHIGQEHEILGVLRC